jgi:hypothetical protein
MHIYIIVCILWDIYIRYYSALRENEILCAGKWMELENIIVKWSKPGLIRKSSHIFYYIRKVDPSKNTSIFKYIYTEQFSKVGLLEETKRGEKEENDREWLILKYITSE